MASIMCHRLPPFTADQIEPALMSKGPFMLEAFVLAMLIYVLSISSIRLVAEKTGDIIHTNQVGICTVGANIMFPCEVRTKLRRSWYEVEAKFVRSWATFVRS